MNNSDFTSLYPLDKREGSFPAVAALGSFVILAGVVVVWLIGLFIHG